MSQVHWFEIPVNDLDRAVKFYNGIFNISLSAMEMNGEKMAIFPHEQGQPGSSGALIKAEGYSPSHSGTIVYFHVESIEDTMARVEEQGGKVIVAKQSIGEHGFISHFEDTEGNRVALHTNA